MTVTGPLDIRITGRATQIAGARIQIAGPSPTHIRLGGVRIGLATNGSIRPAADILETVTRANLRALRDDPRLRDEALRRVISPPCAKRCYVRADGSHDCHCASGFQYASDDEAQALERCAPADVWSDLPSLIAGHHAAGRGDNDPIVCDCDDLGPAALGVAAWIDWFAPQGYQIDGQDLGAYHDDGSRFAIAITRPPNAPVAHLYGLVNRRPPAPQPLIRIPENRIAGGWNVWDPAAHWGMGRPDDSFYTNGEIVAYELRRHDLDGLVPLAA